MAISLVGFGTPAAGIGDVTPTIHASSTTDDIMVLFCESNSGQPVTTVTGSWTQLPDSPQDEGGAGSTCLSIYWRRHDGSESNPTITDTGNHTYAVIATFRGVIATGDPYDVTAGNVANATTTAVSIPGDTTTVNDCMIIAAVSHGLDVAAGTPQVGSWTNASLSSFGEIYDNTTDQGGGGGLGIASGVLATAGAYNATTATLVSASEQGRISFALKPATSGTDHSMEAAVAGVGTAAAALSLGARMSSAIQGTGTVVAALTAHHPLAALIAATGTVAAALEQHGHQQLEAQIFAVGTVSASLRNDYTLAAAISAEGSIVAVLTTSGDVGGLTVVYAFPYRKYAAKKGK